MKISSTSLTIKKHQYIIRNVNLASHNLFKPGSNKAMPLAFYFPVAYIIVYALKLYPRALKLVKLKVALYGR